MKPLLPSKVAIINGGATGMGRSCAYLFAEEGCNCVIADINEEEGKKTAEEASGKDAEAVFIKCDTTDAKQVKNCVDQAVKKFGTVHILVGSAGGSVPRDTSARPRNTDGTPRTGIENINEKYLDVMMDLNYKGHVFFCKEVVPYFKKQNYGKIVLISSMGIYHPPGPSTEYHGAKAAIVGLVTNLAYELGPYGVNVNGILPGPVNTPFWDPVLAGILPEKRPAIMERMGLNNPLGRVGKPEDIGYTCLFLASEMSSFITGQMLSVAGGIPMDRYQESGIIRQVVGGKE